MINEIAVGITTILLSIRIRHTKARTIFTLGKGGKVPGIILFKMKLFQILAKKYSAMDGNKIWINIPPLLNKKKRKKKKTPVVA